MSKLKKQILDILFWVFLIIGIIMVLWRIFGDSPTDLAVVTPFIVIAILKIWNVNNELKDFKWEIKSSFNKVKENMRNINNNINRIENKIDKLSRKK